MRGGDRKERKWWVEKNETARFEEEITSEKAVKEGTKGRWKDLESKNSGERWEVEIGKFKEEIWEEKDERVKMNETGRFGDDIHKKKQWTKRKWKDLESKN